MTSSNPYEPAFKLIECSMEKTVGLYSILTKRIKGYITTLSCFFDKLSQIQLDLPCDRVKKHVMAKVRGPMEIPNFDIQFNEYWIETVRSILIAPKCIETLRDFLTSALLPQLNELSQKYTAKMDELTSMINSANETLKTAEIKRLKADESYRTLCKQIEEQNAKLGGPDSSKAEAALNALIASLPEKESQAAKLCTEFNEALTQHSTTAEKVLSMFQAEEQVKFDDLKALAQQLEEPLRVFSEQVSQLLQDIAQNHPCSKDTLYTDAFFKENDLLHLEQQAGRIEYAPPHLPFSVTDFVDPQDFFKKQLRSYGAFITNSTIEGLPDGTYVTVISKKRTAMQVLDESGGEWEVPISSINQPPDLKRTLQRLTQDCPKTEPQMLEAQNGEIVMVTHVEDGKAHCMNVYNEVGWIPENLLSPI